VRNVFQENFAPYGPEMAGYPFGIKLISNDQYPLASGQKYLGSIIAEVVDFDGNRITIDDNT
jgi:hypothetical protein